MPVKSCCRAARTLSIRRPNYQRMADGLLRGGNRICIRNTAEFANSLAYPRYYLDFETISFSIPIWAGTTPRDTFPYQYSIHVENAPGEYEHLEFLDLTGDNPARACAEALLRDLGESGPILMYTGYERGVIEGLVRYLGDRGRSVKLGSDPEGSDPNIVEGLNALIERLVDLHPPTRDNYYHPDMLGSWSIKAVIPTVAPELDYKALEEVQEGMGAQRAYLEAVDAATSAERKAYLRQRLLEYCEYDTLAMVRLVEFLGQG